MSINETTETGFRDLSSTYSNEANVTPIQAILLKTLEGGPMTRRELVRGLKTPRTTIYDNLLKLSKKRLVKKYSSNNGKRGRPLVYWKLKNGD